MPLSTQICDDKSLEFFLLDPKNPRLGYHNILEGLGQEELLKIMRTWSLEELAESYIGNNGFWRHEALIVIDDDSYGTTDKLIVVEGNRRLAALIYLKRTIEGNAPSSKWPTLIKDAQIPDGLFDSIPYIKADDRKDVQAFLGFRHVTGIKAWDAEEKAGFIASLIEKENLSYVEVMRKIGSKTQTVRNHYIAYRLLRQAEAQIEDYDPKFAENRFALLYGCLRTEGVRSYLRVDVFAAPAQAYYPIEAQFVGRLEHFLTWIFGNEAQSRVVKDTRDITIFGKMLESPETIKYLEQSTNPKFQIAERISGNDETEIIDALVGAANNVELALSTVHFFQKSEKLRSSVRRLAKDVFQLLTVFPSIEKELREEQQDA